MDTIGSHLTRLYILFYFARQPSNHQYFYSIKTLFLHDNITGLPSLCLCGGLCIQWPCRFIKLTKLKPKFRSLRTEESEIKTHKIAVMVF